VTASVTLVLVVAAFLVTMAWAPRLIDALHALKFGKQIRLEGPQSHLVKAGTPTMGGFLFIATPVVLGLLLAPDRLAVGPDLAALGLFGAAGALDDYANMKNKEGLGFRVRYKLVWHGAMALAIAAWLSTSPELHVQRLPGGASVDLGLLFIPIVALAIFSATAGVNLVDGLDGLAGGTSLFAFGSYLMLALGAGIVVPVGGCRASHRRTPRISLVQRPSRQGFYGRYWRARSRRKSGRRGGSNSLAASFAHHWIRLRRGHDFSDSASGVFSTHSRPATFQNEPDSPRPRA
jgi:UDP-N-acetylmuramyl pentapeptide phosphotransferase/UDP-N-acetylglucosamine-1-phosphate transferase